MTIRIKAPGLADGSHVYGPHTIGFSDGVAEVEELHSGVRAYMERLGYQLETSDGTEGEEQGDPAPFDPSAHKVDEVLAYLSEADSDEVERVLSAEIDGKARQGVLEFEQQEVSADGA